MDRNEWDALKKPIASRDKTIEERLMLLEYKDYLRDKTLDDINQKLSQLVQLRDKGWGAFWLVSALLGSSILGGIITIISWLKG